jgi:O-antigen/teichoic acid export membrane protein
MTFAAHVHAAYTISAAIVIVALMVIYWFRLGRSDVPPRRRRVRRISLIGAFVSIPALVAGLTYFGPTSHPIAYVITWSVVLVAVIFVCITAVFDMYVSFEIQQERLSKDLANAREELRDALSKRTSFGDETKSAHERERGS